jgi:hypothetical protein
MVTEKNFLWSRLPEHVIIQQIILYYKVQMYIYEPEQSVGLQEVRLPEFLGSWHNEFGNFVNPKHRPPLTSRIFLLGAHSILGP